MTTTPAGANNHRANLAAVVDHQAFFEQEPGAWLESCAPCAVVLFEPLSGSGGTAHADHVGVDIEHFDH